MNRVEECFSESTFIFNFIDEDDQNITIHSNTDTVASILRDLTDENYAMFVGFSSTHRHRTIGKFIYYELNKDPNASLNSVMRYCGCFAC